MIWKNVAIARRNKYGERCIEANVSHSGRVVGVTTCSATEGTLYELTFFFNGYCEHRGLSKDGNAESFIDSI